MTKIDIYSGFLGAGKTTLIKKMITESYKGQKLVLMRWINLNSINTSSTWHSQDLNLVAAHILSPLGHTPGKGALPLGPAVGNRSASLQETSCAHG